MTRILIDPLDYWDGTENAGPTSLAYWDGATATPLEEPLLYIPRGYADVDDMLSRPMVYIAHRGGSVEYPEMSRRGYTQSAVEGFGCLEFSAARTSDGVIIGCHDSYINRVVGLPGTNLAVSGMTWAQIQTYMVQPPAQHPERAPEPFIRLEQLVADYGSSHLIMFDPKSISPTHYPSILSYMDANGGPSRWMGKWVGSNSAWSTALRARGYKSWGAYYSTDDRSMVTNSQAQWDVLGFNFGGSAPQEDWDFILSFGKRVWCHVSPDQAGVDTGVAKGATGAMVSGTEAVDVYKIF